MRPPRSGRPPLTISIDPYSDTMSLTLEMAEVRDLPKGTTVQIWFENFVRDGDIGAIALTEDGGKQWRRSVERGEDGHALRLTAEAAIPGRNGKVDISLKAVQIRDEEILPVLPVVMTRPGQAEPDEYRVAATISRPRPVYRFPLELAWLGDRQVKADGRPHHFVLGLMNPELKPLVLPAAEDGDHPRAITFDLELISLRKMSFDGVRVSPPPGGHWTAQPVKTTQGDRYLWTLTFSPKPPVDVPLTLLGVDGQSIAAFLIEGIAVPPRDDGEVIMVILKYNNIPQYRDGQYFLPLPAIV